MTTRLTAAIVVLFVACGPPQDQSAARAAQPSQLPTGTLDQLLAPIALYPDALLAQILMSAQDPPKVAELDKWFEQPELIGEAHHDVPTAVTTAMIATLAIQ